MGISIHPKRGKSHCIQGGGMNAGGDGTWGTCGPEPEPRGRRPLGTPCKGGDGLSGRGEGVPAKGDISFC